MNEPIYPLAHLQGAFPPAPEWFEHALLCSPQSVQLTVEGAAIELLAWGNPGQPGILLAHGGMAHARWWSHIAPHFARTHRVAALSWSGMGGSGWRDTYSVDTYVAEAMAAAQAADLFAAGPPVFVAHSFGGAAMALAAHRHGARLAGTAFIDSGVSPPHPSAYRHRATPGTRAYPTLEAALARFRLAPEQSVENLFIANRIARDALHETPDGWRWRFDPGFFTRMDPWDSWSAIADPACPLAFIHGELSRIVPPELRARQQSQTPARTPFIEIPASHHHVMIDQPLALVATLRSLIAVWHSTQG
jgi:pimeloyl-ACP methyl ester carboxylesterase